MFRLIFFITFSNLYINISIISSLFLYFSLANKVDKISSFEYMETYNKLNIEKLIVEGKTSIDKILLYPCSCLLVDGERDPRIDSSMIFD